MRIERIIRSRPESIVMNAFLMRSKNIHVIRISSFPIIGLYKYDLLIDTLILFINIIYNVYFNKEKKNLHIDICYIWTNTRDL